MIQLRTLGQLDLRTADGNELRAVLAQPKRFALLVYLASAPEPGFCRRDTLVAMFWPELNTESARAALRKALHFLRQHSGDDVFARRGADEIGLASGAITLDARAMESAVRAGAFEDALHHYRGEFLNGFYVEGAPDVERWAESERERLRNIAVGAAWHVAEAKQAAGDYHGARSWAEWALHAAPPSETALRRLLSLLERSGDRAAAFAAYHTFAERLDEEFGIIPSEETRTLLDALRSRVGELEPRGDPAPVPAPPLLSEQKPMTAPRRSWSKRTLSVLAASVVVVMVGAFAMLKSPPAIAEDGLARLAVLPFDVAAAPRLQYLDDGLAVLLSTRLDGAGALRTVDARSVLTWVERENSESRPQSVADYFDANLYVTGSVAQAGDELQIEAALYRTDARRPIITAQASGREAALMSMVDDVSRQLLAGYLRGQSGRLTETAALTSGSLPALKAYLRGEELSRRARYEEAREAFQQAIALDSTFALAYYRLSIATAWTGRMAESRHSVDKAARFANRLSERNRLLVDALHSSRATSIPEAERLYLTYLQSYPDDYEAWFELAEVVFHSAPVRGMSVGDARAAFERVLSFDRDDQPSLVHLARIAATQRKLAELDSITARVLRLAPRGDHTAEMRLFRATLLKDRVAENALIRDVQLEGYSRILDAAWRVSSYTEACAALRRIAARLEPIMTGEWHAGLLLLDSHLAAATGDWPTAMRILDVLEPEAPIAAMATRGLFAADRRAPFTNTELRDLRDQIARIDLHKPSDRRIYLGNSARDALDPSFRDLYVGAISLRLGDQATARARLADIQARRYSVLPFFAGAQLASLIALQNHRPDDAIRVLLEASDTAAKRTTTATPLMPRAMMRRTLAAAYQKTGQVDEAARWRRSLPEDLGFGVLYLVR